MAVGVPTTLLLGGGYTLERLAERLSPGTFVITSRSQERCREWRTRGWFAEQVSVTEPATVSQVFDKYPALHTVIDSVPPLRSEDPAAGVRTVVGAMKGIQRVAYLSTTGVFGRRDGAWVREDTLPLPWNAQGSARQASEELYRASGVTCTALRLPAIYGPDRGTERSLKAGTYRFIDDGDNWTNRIHVDDLVEVLWLLLDLEEWPKVLCVSDDEPTKAKEVIDFLCVKYGLPKPPSISALEAERQGLYTMLSNQRVDNAFMKQLLGIALRYPSYRSACADAASEG
jgi:nucleoside-diphosphate-sugar epimerase